MAEIIPALSTCLSRMTAGEKRFARRLEAFLEEDYLCWYDIPVGRKRRFPDFIVLHPGRGLLFIEVKDWKLQNIKKISHQSFELLTERGLVTQPNPMDQARQYAYAVLDKLKGDKHLIENDGRFAGHLTFPYGYGVVFTNIARHQLDKAVPQEYQDKILPPHLVICQNEMTETTDPETFQASLWGMFNYQFGQLLSLPQINRIRWHLFPELRLDKQTGLFEDEPAGNATGEASQQKIIPDIIKVMDLNQEKLARSMGGGHRVIHGVAGSGKTIILGYRCVHLAQLITKPILVLCFNITLATRLRAFIAEKGVADRVQIYHFHDWCGEQLKTYHCNLVASDAPVWERQVVSVIQAVEQGRVPRAQYGALLIDEGHDFEPEWLKLVAQMVDPLTNSVLLLYDDAQSIYKQKTGLGFSLSSVGIQAQGRTTILKLNYRNTREILEFAYRFAKKYIQPHTADDDHVPIIEPEAAGISGVAPAFRQFASMEEEMAYLVRCLCKWRQDGIALRDIVILICPGNWFGERIQSCLDVECIPSILVTTPATKRSFLSGEDKISLMNIHSSKGLEFHSVVMAGLGHVRIAEDELEKNVRLLYVGMTRARENLLLTASARNELTAHIENINTTLCST